MVNGSVNKEACDNSKDFKNSRVRILPTDPTCLKAASLGKAGRVLLKSQSMRWFKHDSTAIKDEKIQLLMSNYGVVGYAIFFILCELCSEKIDSQLIPSIEISWPYIEQLTHSKRSTIRRVLDGCAAAGLLLDNSDDKLLICSIPNLLKRLDNWTSRSVVTTEQLRNRIRSKKKEEEVRTNGASHFKNKDQKKCHDCERLFPNDVLFNSHLSICREEVKK